MQQPGNFNPALDPQRMLGVDPDTPKDAKSMAGLQGVDSESVAGHSFRRGGASYAFRAGVPDVLIQRQGDWQSMAYREFLTLPAAKALEATRAMFGLMLQPPAEGGLGASMLQAGLEPMDNAVRGRSALGLFSDAAEAAAASGAPGQRQQGGCRAGVMEAQPHFAMSMS
eukprot:jgi/Ulvmu1/12164/UM085_0028.1